MDLQNEEIKKKYTKCLEHRDEPITLFCVQCDRAVCFSCILDAHNAHKLCKIVDIANTKYQELCKLIVPCNDQNLEVKQEHGQHQVTSTLEQPQDEHLVSTIEGKGEGQKDIECHKPMDQRTAVENEGQKETADPGSSQTQRCRKNNEERLPNEHQQDDMKPDMTSTSEEQPSQDINKNTDVTRLDKVLIESREIDKEEKNQHPIMRQVLNVLQKLQLADQAQSLFLDEIVTDVTNRTSTLVKELEKQKDILLSKARQLRSQQQQKLAQQKEDLEVCVFFLNMLERETSPTSDLDQILQLKVLEILKTLQQKDDTFVMLGEHQGFCSYQGGARSDNAEIVRDVLGCSINPQSVNTFAEAGSDCLEGTGEYTANDKDVQGHDASDKFLFAFGKKEIKKISPIEFKAAFIVSDGNLYRVNFEDDAETIKQLQPIMTDVVDISRVTTRGIYICQDNKSLVMRYSADGKIYRFTYVSNVKCIHCLTDTDIFVAAQDDTIIGDDAEVQQYDIKGILIKKWFIFATKDCHLLSLCMFSNFGLVLLYHSDSSRGCVYNAKEQKAVYKGSIGHSPQRHFQPKGLCSDESGNILITDQKNHAVHLIDKNGKLKKFLMMEEDGLSLPVSVALDKEGYMWIGCSSGIIHVIRYNPGDS